jgi:tetratricopeptide (TPR) repeat protein
LNALARIEGPVPPEIQDDIEFLRANIYMATGRPGEAVQVLQEVHAGDDLAGFVAYNLGIALLQEGRQQEAVEQLDKAGQLPAADAAGLAIRDKSNLVLGTLLFEAGDTSRADRGPRPRAPRRDRSPTRPCCGRGRRSRRQHFDRALVPWNILTEREPTDAAVQEAMLAAPYAYASLNLHGRAALMYGRALEQYQHPDREGGRLPGQHPGRPLPDRARARGEPAGRGLGDPAARPARGDRRPTT